MSRKCWGGMENGRNEGYCWEWWCILYVRMDGWIDGCIDGAWDRAWHRRIESNRKRIRRRRRMALCVLVLVLTYLFSESFYFVFFASCEIFILLYASREELCNFFPTCLVDLLCCVCVRVCAIIVLRLCDRRQQRRRRQWPKARCAAPGTFVFF